MRRIVILGAWTFLTWTLLTWTFTVEQVAFGLVLSALVAVGLAPLGPASGRWRAPRPRRLAAALWLPALVAGKVVAANVDLAVRVWRPDRPLTSGMVVVPTSVRSVGGLAAVGVLTSLIADNQLVDVDRRGRRLQYHTVAVPAGDEGAVRDAINGPVERLL
ncbi:MAG: Na+/H+ antiporter subunit E [Pseudonocardia sp.]|nr:Na+/H+ antiporter subunit E [Pseudonocardia sp.]